MNEPWWVSIVKAGIIINLVLFAFAYLTLAERKIMGRMQLRYGPNRAGPFGLLQPIADALKLPLKEDIIPTSADKLVFVIAPIVSAAPAFVSFAIIPFGTSVSIFHHRTPLQLTDLPVAVLLVLAMSSIGVYGLVLAGWASGSPLAIWRRSASSAASSISAGGRWNCSSGVRSTAGPENNGL